MGHTGESAHPEVAAACRKVIAAA
ncbi:hypothetical protein [Paraburkholderia sp. SIMBA_030]